MRPPNAALDFTGSLDDLADDLTPPPPVTKHRQFKWSRLLLVALAGLVSMALGPLD